MPVLELWIRSSGRRPAARRVVSSIFPPVRILGLRLEAIEEQLQGEAFSALTADELSGLIR